MAEWRNILNDEHSLVSSPGGLQTIPNCAEGFFYIKRFSDVAHHLIELLAQSIKYSFLATEDLLALLQFFGLV